MLIEMMVLSFSSQCKSRRRRGLPRDIEPFEEADPWAVLGASAILEPGTVPGPGASGAGLGLPVGIGLTGNGGLDVAGLE